MKKTKWMLKSLLVLGAAVTLVACGAKEESTTSSTAETTTSESSSASAWKDGTYKAESGFDERGWKFVHEITIEGGKITASTADYEDKDGNLKSENAEYNATMKEKSGVSSAESTDKLDEELLAAQSADVEVVSGATHTSENFKKSTEALLKAAEEGNTDTITLTFE
ncbi:TPA: FMN-binding protein [Streptococcus suis]|uniref:FMN-binding protein n=1 Tax=Streptococcus suis TaxID=1307 RepID=A0A9X4MN54_STRSU|nr:FMN-binding protein [Streptococcus parasuis]MDG4498275.1 FMN-binding protein [Streptococcus suis]MDG4513117.1 FMN-binding protein [Streptococcus suis]MDG4525733.1 FMN-binding protein [Streptococcus suis]QWV87293.1 FMN-binding protein [Streptococcus parasuis]ULL20549.1 FMN-binding protein [Streptococcus suis]